jgi:hypothetical protein
MDRKEIALKRARDGFAHWRATRKAKEPIPKELFQLAARAVELSDVSSVAFELGLNHGRLVRGLADNQTSEAAPLLKANSSAAASGGLHFSRFDPPVQEQAAQATPAKDAKEKVERVHAQVHFQNGIVVSLNSLASVRVWCRAAARLGGV